MRPGPEVDTREELRAWSDDMAYEETERERARLEVTADDARPMPLATADEWADWLTRQLRAGLCSACAHPLHGRPCGRAVTLAGWDGPQETTCGCGGCAACAVARERGAAS